MQQPKYKVGDFIIWRNKVYDEGYAIYEIIGINNNYRIIPIINTSKYIVSLNEPGDYQIRGIDSNTNLELAEEYMKSKEFESDLKELIDGT